MKIKKTFILGLVVLLVGVIGYPLSTIPTTVKAASNEETLNIYNWGDYIYDGEGLEEDDENNPTPSVVEQFEEFYNNKYQSTGKTVKVVYSTFDTNETMLNKLETEASQYDLVCPSDYIIQKMISKNMIERIDNIETKIPNYFTYASHYLQDLFTDNGWTDYAVGYMWGTVGLTYDPDDVDEEDMKTWQSLWSTDYNGKIQVKDSMRDTYLVGVMKVYKNELNEAKSQYTSGAITAAQYNAKLTEIFNRNDDDTIAKVEKALSSLNNNLYGYEVDSGKNDVARGTVDINLAWSGDAVYSMDTAEDEYDGKVLKYSVPEEGSNVWFDGWCIPKGGNVDLACEFLDFISDPSIAKQNMEYIGYTSFIAGEDILDMVWDWYGDESGTRSVDLTYFFDSPEASAEFREKMIVKTNQEVGRQFDTQYPSKEVITRCSVMQDFGERNEAVVAMWERVRAYDVPVWLIIVCVVVVLGVVGVIVITKTNKNKRHHRRKIS